MRPAGHPWVVSAPSFQSLRWLGDRILDGVFPATCAGCGREGALLCPRCLPALYARSGERAGVPFGLPATLPSPLVQLEWCAPFSGPVRGALHALKYAGERRLAEPLGRALAARWREAGAGGDVLVAVPVHAERARGRGYDQAVLLAEAAGRELGLPAVVALERTRATVAQYQLGRGERAANVTGAFGPHRGAAGRVAGRWVVLVDDVVTTGATLAACAATLMDAGAVAVSAIAVAHER